MSWEEIAKTILGGVFNVGVTLLLIVIAWMIMWHFFLSKIRFVREILFPDGNDKKKETESRNKTKRDRKLRKD